MRDEEEIRDEEANATDLIVKQNGPSKWPGMTYEQGVQSALQWVLEDSDEPPIEPED